MKNYALDSKLLPKVWLTWQSTKGGEFHKRYWLNCQTGKKKDKPESWMRYDTEADIRKWGYNKDDKRIRFGATYHTEKSPQIWVNANSSLKYVYIKYHPDIDRLEVAAVEMDTSRQEVPHSWRFIGKRYFIGKDKSIIDQNGNIANSYDLYTYHWAYSGRELISMLLRLNIPHSLLPEFKKFVGADYFTIGNGNTVLITNPWQLQQWYITVQKTRTTGKQQKLTDELTKYPLSDATGFSEKYPVEQESEDYYSTDLRDVVYFERINEELSVLRAFMRTPNGILNEAWRMYIGDKGLNRIVSKSANGWIPSKQVRSGWRNSYNFVNSDEAIKQCPRIKYILGATDKIAKSKQIDFLITALRFPEIEQLAKLGYQEKCISFATSHQPKADMKQFFGDYYNDKEKNLLRKIGMSKEQLDHYMSVDNYDRTRSLRTMRDMFGDNLTYMDKDSFITYYNGCSQVCRYFWRGLSSFTNSLNIEQMRFFKNVCRLAEKRENVWSIVNDTLNAYQGLNITQRPEVDWYFDDLSDLTRTHDVLIELKRIQDAERRARWDKAEAERRQEEEKKRIKLDKERKTYEYEDDNYIIRLPKDGNEIINEGNTQHICIGSYVGRHSTGGTNLFFLREKSEDSVPFYAIEMSNDKRIVQIHGFGNKWLGNNPEAIPTVIRWLRKNDISCSDQILTCKAKGYGSCNDYVPMPVVD